MNFEFESKREIVSVLCISSWPSTSFFPYVLKCPKSPRQTNGIPVALNDLERIIAKTRFLSKHIRTSWMFSSSEFFPAIDMKQELFPHSKMHEFLWMGDSSGRTKLESNRGFPLTMICVSASLSIISFSTEIQEVVKPVPAEIKFNECFRWAVIWKLSDLFEAQIEI